MIPAGSISRAWRPIPASGSAHHPRRPSGPGSVTVQSRHLSAVSSAGRAKSEAQMTTSYAGEPTAVANAQIVARLERIPITRRLLWIRIIIGSATFFDAYTVLVIAFAMPQLVTDWGLSPTEVGLI